MIVTFYSFKGGVGRSMAMVNVAEMLVDAGYRVTMCDWDLEAPGLERYVCESSDKAEKFLHDRGVMDLLTTYKQVMSRPHAEAADQGPEEGRTLLDRLERPSALAVPIEGQPERAGSLRLLTAGRRAGDAWQQYAQAVRNFSWTEFYDHWAGGAYLEFLRNDLGRHADVVLVDSRTGVTEHGGVCTHHLADLVVLLTAANDLNMDGVAWMAENLSRPELTELRKGRHLELLPCAIRIEQVSEIEQLAEFRTSLPQRLAQYVPRSVGPPEAFLAESEIPYVPGYSFKERVVAREGRREGHRELYDAYAALTKAIVRVGLAGRSLKAPPADGDLRRSLRTEIDELETADKHRVDEILASDGQSTPAGDGEQKRIDLRRVNLRNKHLAGTRLSGADLGLADLRSADLQGAHLEEADLRAADLREANLREARLHDANLCEADLRNADLRNVDGSGANLAGARLGGTDLGGADLSGASGLSRAQLAGCTISKQTRLPETPASPQSDRKRTGVHLCAADNRDDERFANNFQLALMGFERPWLNAMEELAGAAWRALKSLGAGHRTTVDESEYLLLLASPAAAACERVRKDVKGWIEAERTDKLVLVLTDGEIHWDEVKGDFDWDRTTALPRELSGAFRNEPPQFDLRWAREEKHLGTTDPRFVADVARIAALIRRCPAGELIRAETEGRLQALRAAGVVMGLLGVLMLVFFGVWRQASTTAETLTEQLAQKTNEQMGLERKLGEATIALQQAKKASGDAERRRANSQVTRLASQADTIVDKSPQRGLLLAVEALRSAPADGPVRARAEQSVRGALATCSGHGLGSYQYSTGASGIALGNDRLAVIGGDNAVHLWALSAGKSGPKEIDLRGRDGRATGSVRISPDGRWLVTTIRDRSGRERGLSLWDLKSPDPSKNQIALIEPVSPVDNVAFSPDGRWLVAAARSQSSDASGASPDQDPKTTRTAARYVVYRWGLSVGDGRMKAENFRKTRATFPFGSTGAHLLKISSDSRWLLAARRRGDTARVWDLTAKSPSDARPATFKVNGIVVAAAFGPKARKQPKSPGNCRLALAGSYGGVEVYNLTAEWKPEPAFRGEAEQTFGSLSFSSDGRWLLGVGSNLGMESVLWDMTSALSTDIAPASRPGNAVEKKRPAEQTKPAAGDFVVPRPEKGKKPARTVAESAPLPVRISSDGKSLVAGAREMTKLYSLGKEGLEKWEPLMLRGHGGYVRSTVFITRGKDWHWLVTAGEDGVAFVWIFAAPKPADIGEILRDMVFPPLRVMKSPYTVKADVTLRGHEGPIITLAVSPNSRWLVSGSSDGSARVWDLNGPMPSRTDLTLPRVETPGRLVFSFGTPFVAVADTSKTVRVWDVAAGQPRRIYTIKGLGAPSGIWLSPDGEICAAKGDRDVYLWRLKTGKALGSFKDPPASRFALAFSQDARLLAVGGKDAVVRLRGAESGKLIRSLTGHAEDVNCVSFSRNGELLATGSEDKTVRLWDVATGKQTRQFTVSKKPAHVVFSPDRLGRNVLAVGSEDGRMRLWAVKDGRELTKPSHKTERVIPVCFSPDGKLLATTSSDSDGDVGVWDISTMKRLAALRLPRRPKQYMPWTFARDAAGLNLITLGASDAAVGSAERLHVCHWPLDTKALVDRAQRVVGRNLSLSEWKNVFPDEEYRRTFPGLPEFRPGRRPEIRSRSVEER